MPPPCALSWPRVAHAGNQMKVMINSLPKSGTNLVQKLLELSGMPFARKSLAASSVYGRHGMAKRVLRTARFGISPVVVGLDHPLSVSPDWLERYLDSVPEGRYLTGHAAYSAHLNALLLEADFRTIQVIRHPADVIVSFARYAAESVPWISVHGYFRQVDLRTRADLLIEGGYIPGTRTYVRGLAEQLRSIEGWHSSASNALTLRFEDIVGSKGGGDDDAQVRAITKVFDHLSLNDKDPAELSKLLFGGTHTFRGGRIASATSVLSPDQISQIDTIIAENLTMTGLGYGSR